MADGAIVELGSSVFARVVWLGDHIVTLPRVFWAKLVEAPQNLLSILSWLIAFYGFMIAARINLKNKIADCVMHCNLRYDALYAEKSRLSQVYSLSSDITNTSSFKHELRNYYNRYWGLKSDQFDYWLSGLVDPENMCGYYYSVLRSFQFDRDGTDEQHPFSNRSFRSAWESGQDHNRASDPMFNGLIDDIIRAAVALDQVLIEIRQSNDLISNKKSRTIRAYAASYHEVVALLDQIERHNKPAIGFMTNIPLRLLMAKRSRMQAYARIRAKVSQTQKGYRYSRPSRVKW